MINDLIIKGFNEEFAKLAEQVSAAKMTGQLGVPSQMSPGLSKVITPRTRTFMAKKDNLRHWMTTPKM